MAQMRCILESDFRGGAWNMAVDCAIADAVAGGEQPPTLRLYGWNPFCLSLGYGQRAREANRPALKARGWDLLRRPTGGKAILHGDELTYSLCLPLDHPLACGDLVESYRRISIGLLRALECLGLSASAGPRQDNASARSRAAGPVCFELPSHYEVMAAGRKLIGSAQMRRRSLMLQHGTLPLSGDVARICDVLEFATDAEREARKLRLRERAITLAQALGWAPTWTEAAEAVEQGFSEAFDITFVRGRLSDCEAANATAYQADRFGNPQWTDKR